MKSILCLFSLYITLLSVLPCLPETDNCDVQHDEQSQKTAIASSSGETENAAIPEEVCSPFCFCQLCRTVIVCSELPEFTFQSIPYSSNASPIPGMIAGKTGKIDKPPKYTA